MKLAAELAVAHIPKVSQTKLTAASDSFNPSNVQQEFEATETV